MLCQKKMCGNSLHGKEKGLLIVFLFFFFLLELVSGKKSGIVPLFVLQWTQLCSCGWQRRLIGDSKEFPSNSSVFKCSPCSMNDAF